MGLILLMKCVSELPALFLSVASIFEYVKDAFVESVTSVYVITGFIAALLALYLCFFSIKFLLFKPELIVDKLKLTNNFDEEKFELNIHSSTVIRIAIIFIGANLLIEYSPVFLRNLYHYFFAGNNGGILGLVNGGSVDALDLLEYAAKLLIGYLLIAHSLRVTTWMERMRRK